MQIEFCWRKIFELFIIYKPPLGTCEVQTKFGPARFSRFDVLWIKNKQTDIITDKQII